MWSSIIVICTIHLFSISRGPKWLFYISKPLPILLMATSLYLAGIGDASFHAMNNSFGLWVLVGLLLSAMGDAFLMHPKDKFVAGLSCFLFAHIAYSIGFFQTIESITWWIPAGFLAVGVLVFLLLLPSLGAMIIPVALYIVVIVAMTASAAEFWVAYRSSAGLLALVGALMFMTSDLVLAIDRFRSASHFSRHVVMVTYYTAQGLITLSVLASLTA